MASVFKRWCETTMWKLTETVPWSSGTEPNPWVKRDRFLTYFPGINTVFHLVVRTPGSYGDVLNLLILVTALMLAVTGGLYGAYTHEEVLRHDAAHSPGGMYWCAETFNSTHFLCADHTKDEDGCAGSSHRFVPSYLDRNPGCSRLLEIGDVCISRNGFWLGVYIWHAFNSLFGALIMFAIIYMSQGPVARQKKRKDQMSARDLREIEAWWAVARWFVAFGVGLMIYGLTSGANAAWHLTLLKSPDIWLLSKCDTRLSVRDLQVTSVAENQSFQTETHWVGPRSYVGFSTRNNLGYSMYVNTEFTLFICIIGTFFLIPCANNYALSTALAPMTNDSDTIGFDAPDAEHLRLSEGSSDIAAAIANNTAAVANNTAAVTALLKELKAQQN